jgi:hypothetical protein
MNIIKNCMPQPEKSVKEIEKEDNTLQKGKKKEKKECITKFNATYNKKDSITESTNSIKTLDSLKNDNIISLPTEMFYVILFGNVEKLRKIFNIPEKFPGHLLGIKIGFGKLDRLNTHVQHYKNILGVPIIVIKTYPVYNSREIEKKIKDLAKKKDWNYYLKDNSGNAAYPLLNPTEHIYITQQELDDLCKTCDDMVIQSNTDLDCLLSKNSNLITSLESNVLELKQQISVLNEEKEKSNDLSKENQELKEKLIVIEEKVNDKNTILDYMKKDINEKDKKIEKLNEKLIRKKEKIKSLKEKLSSWTRNENNCRLERIDENEEYENQEYVEKEV